MSKFVEIFQDLVTKALKDIHQFVIQFAPKMTLSIIILLIGWICALLLKKIVSKILKALGFDVLSEKTGITAFLERGGIQKKPSSMVGLVFYWFILFSALVMVFNTMELEVASRLINQTLFYIPKTIVALVLLALGMFLSRFVGKFVETTSHLANIPFYIVLGKAARYAIIGLALIAALEYLNVSSAIIVESFVIIFIVVPLALSLIFLIGGRDIISSILAGRFLMKEYKKGDAIEFDLISGQIQSIDFLTTKITSKEGKIIVPNSDLVKKVVKKKT